jgi:hypothetical protein
VGLGHRPVALVVLAQAAAIVVRPGHREGVHRAAQGDGPGERGRLGAVVRVAPGGGHHIARVGVGVRVGTLGGGVAVPVSLGLQADDSIGGRARAAVRVLQGQGGLDGRRSLLNVDPGRVRGLVGAAEGAGVVAVVVAAEVQVGGDALAGLARLLLGHPGGSVQAEVAAAARAGGEGEGEGGRLGGALVPGADVSAGGAAAGHGLGTCHRGEEGAEEDHREGQGGSLQGRREGGQRV